MSNTLQLKALLTKNVILMKRNLCSTLCEILFPIILMMLLVAVRNLIKVEENIFDYTDLAYLRNESSALTTNENITDSKVSFWNEMTYRNPYISCSKRKKKTNLIAIVSAPEKYQGLTEKMSKFATSDFTPKFRHFQNKTQLFDYIKDIRYGQLDNFPLICFGFTYLKTEKQNYNISIHFPDTNVVSKIKEIPTTLIPALDPFKIGPDMTSYEQWIHSGALQIQQILNEQILQDETDDKNAELSLGVIPEKYYSVYDDKFGEFIGAILSFFLVIAYLCPLCILVFRIVQEKESRAKEGMKIMGLTNLTYFLSFFIYWFVLNTIYSLINAYILTFVLKYVAYIWIFIFLWLYGMTIFAFAYLLQSTMNKTRVAMIMTVLLYFVMYFISPAVLQQDIPSGAKLFLSIMPTTCLGFGLFTLTKFDSNQVNFSSGQLTIKYLNFSVADMYIMLIVDIFLYLFMGYYLENVLPQEFGLTKNWNFLCTKNFWCKKKSKISNLNVGNLSISKMNASSHSNSKYEKNRNNENENNNNNNMSIDNKLNENLLGKNNNNNNNQNEESKDYINTPNVVDRLSRVTMKKGGLNSKENFQSEEIYKDRLESGSALQIKNLKKIFEDGKKAVDGLSINFYQNEIFALLGHNGAGKSTTISILTGLYEATAGEAIYEGENILEEGAMEELRKIMGICPQNDVLFSSLTVKEHLEMFSIFKGVPSENVSEEVDKIMNDLMFVNKKNTLAKFLSGGEKRKLSIALALIGGSKIVFLDEPSSGMDITSRRNLWEILKKICNDRIIVLTTHYMEEAAVLGNRIGIMSNGQLKCCGNNLFLIDKFGKYISLNIFKNKKASDKKIIEFVKSTLKEKITSFNNENLLESIETEILSEEILIRIPKTNDFSFKNFFEVFDENLKDLNIKTYEASMPSLEDVFLNVTAETSIKGEKKDEINKNENRNNINNINNNNDNNLNEEELIMKENLKIKGSFSDQFIALTNKRLINLYRDKKSFLLEIIVPFVLVLIGLLISSVTFFENSPSFLNDINALPLPEKIIIGKNLIIKQDYNQSKNLVDDYFLKTNDIKVENISSYDNKFGDMTQLEENLVDFNNYLFKLYNKTDAENQKKLNAFGNYLFMKLDNDTKKFQFVTYLNTNARFGPVIFPQNMFNKIINYAKGKNLNAENSIKINSFTEPIPLTNEEKNAGQARNISNLVFFVSVAFALIPANFITIIIRERELNNKHLQLLSGVSKFRYWISNFIFELLKYYVIGGLISIVIYLFDDFVQYFWMFYVFYGPSMIIFTYFLSFIFDNESSGQNGVILLNFLLGTLAGNVILVFRVLPDTTDLGKSLANIFRIVPSFSLTYGYSQLLLKDLLITIDKNIGKDISMLDLEYAGMDLVFLGICFVLSLIILVIIESNIFRGKAKRNIENQISDIGINSNNGQKNNNNGFKDKSVNYDESDYEENVEDLISTPYKKDENEDLEKNPENNNDNKYSIQVKDLVKTYSAGGFLGLCKKEYPAVKKLSFDLKFGECFALLGVTGAGKTSTFKCLTNETNFNEGIVEINGMKVENNLSEISNLIGYCPQKDAIFDYMTVYENLNFYAAIKGINENRDSIIMDLIREMNLDMYRDKISGKLSGGNKRKLSVAISLIGNPPIILLDEPSTGMDPEARRFMWAVIYKISTRNKLSSVVLTTHSMEEAETLCRRIGIMVDGEFKCLGTNQFIKDKYGDSFEISYTINNMRNDLLSNIFQKAFPNKNSEQIEEFIVYDTAIDGLRNLEKKDIYLKLFSNFVFNDLNEAVEENEKTTITIKSFCKYVYYMENILELISNLLAHFKSINVIYVYENNIKLKLPKSDDQNTPTIGFLLGMLEENKRKLNISEFSITQTSLEQIFNKFASEKETVVRSDIKEISVLKGDL